MSNKEKKLAPKQDKTGDKKTSKDRRGLVKTEKD